MNIKYKKILVTGGGSAAGGGLKTIVARNEYPGRIFIFPSSKECNLLNFSETKEYIEQTNPDAVIHFAAVSGGLPLTINHPASVMRDNVLMNFNIIEASRLCCIDKILMTLSAAIYPLNASIPIVESAIHDGYPHEANYSYAFAKRLIDPIIKAYRHEYRMNIIGIVPDAILGPRSNFNPETSTAVPALIRRFYELRNTNEPLLVWGDGSPLRQITSAEDIGRIAMWCIDHYNDQQILNVGTMEEISIKDAAFLVAEYLCLDKRRISFDLSKPKGTYRKATDNSKFVKLSMFAYAPIRETIRATIEYFVSAYPNPEKLRL